MKRRVTQKAYRHCSAALSEDAR